MSKKHELQEYTAQSGKNLQLGQAGYEYLVTDSTNVETTETGHYVAFTVLEDDCLIIIVDGSTSHSGGHAVTLGFVPKGITIYGHWLGVSIKRSGSSNTSAIVYKG